jgi:branched-chain amino acid transport system substrate-binding protein
VKTLIHLLIFIGTLSLVCGCDQQPVIQPSGKIIKIGVIGAFTGPHFAKGKNGLEGIRTAMAMQPLLQNGDRVELVVEDDQNKPGLAVKALKKLTQEDKVSAVLILSGSEPVLEIAPIADGFKTPVLAVIATHPEITANSHYISQLCFDDNFQGTVAALFVMDDLLIENVAVFCNPDNPYSRFLADRFTQKFESIGGHITEYIKLTRETDNYTGILENIRSKETELLYLPVNVEDLFKIVKAAGEMGWNPKKLGSDGLLATVLTQHKEEAGLLEGILATDSFGTKMPLTPLGESAQDKYRALYKTRGTSYTAIGVEGYTLVLDAMNRCGTELDREHINRMIRSTVDFIGTTGKITIQPDGKALRPLSVNYIKEGELEFVVKVY